MSDKINSNIDKEIANVFIENFSFVSRLAHSLNLTLSEAAYLFPITEEKLGNLKENESNYIELLISRFSKLQDMLGSKIFRGIIALDVEDAGSMLDILNKMEKKYIIEDTGCWLKLRKTRNNIIHEYIPIGEKAAQTLNDVFEQSSDLFNIIINVKNYAEKQFKLDLSKFDLKNLK